MTVIKLKMNSKGTQRELKENFQKELRYNKKLTSGAQKLVLLGRGLF